MCAIFGFHGFNESGLLERMSEKLRHRGPDASSIYRDGQLSMGFCRLTIIDQKTGQQPIYNETRTVTVTQNGEIYNYVELRDELLRLGHVFSTESDTEVIVHAYEEWGLDFLSHLNGMFAIALHDREKNKLILARDRFGQKPLYYYHQAGKLIYASEIKAILLSQHVTAQPNFAAIDPYLALRYVPEPQTMFADVFTLPAAHMMVIDSKSEAKISRYWQVDPNTEIDRKISDADWLNRLDESFSKSIELTLRSDVPVAAYLSSGVDSSLMVAAIKKQTTHPLKTFSLGFNLPNDETAAAEQTAKLLGTEHTSIQVTGEDFSLLPRIIHQMDRPVGDALIIAFDRLSAAAAAQVRVVLSGEGADEMFAGYSFTKLHMMAQKLYATLPTGLIKKTILPAARAFPLSTLNRLSPFPSSLGKDGKNRIISFLEKFPQRDTNSNSVHLRTLFSEQERDSLYAKNSPARVENNWLQKIDIAGGERFLEGLLSLQYLDWLQDWSLIRQDKNAMAHSLETRAPFLDHNLVELVFRMPAHLKLSGRANKIIERRLAARMLPVAVSQRKKIPFFLPLQHYTENPALRDIIAMTLDAKRVKRRGYFDPSAVQSLRDRLPSGEFLPLKQTLSLAILELWHMIFIDGEQP